jgi:hypothetical protein
MRDRCLTKRALPVAATVIAVVLLGGCAQMKDFFTGASRSDSSSADTGILGAPEIDYYLSELELLASGDPASQAEIFADAQTGSQVTPGPQTNLRFALVLATPGHPETNSLQASSMLREVLAAPELLTQAEIALATIHLKSAERLASAESEVQRLRSILSRATQSQENATTRRLAAVEAENRRLRRDLAEAEEKLEAITSIERSIREQD